MQQKLPSNYGPKQFSQLVIFATDYYLKASTANRLMKCGPARKPLSDIFANLDVQLIVTSTRRQVTRSSTRNQCWAILFNRDLSHLSPQHQEDQGVTRCHILGR